MPENADFALEILVGSTPLPEYEKDGHYYVESNLSTPYSYTMSSADTVGGETEAQNWPVTPYALRLTAKWLTDTYYYRVTVDGVKVKGLSLVPGQSREISGFRDGPCLREFLFSLPRFAKDENDRIEEGRECQIGVIAVECWNAVLKTTKHGIRKNFLDFKQANKKDSNRVTQGNHIMATSKAGKVVASRSLYRSVDSWKLQSLRSQLQVRYHMGHTLQEMGFTLVPVNWPKGKKRSRKYKEQKAVKRPPAAETPEGGDESGSDGDEDDEAVIVDEVVVKKEMVAQPSVSDTGIVVDLTNDSDEDSDGSVVEEKVDGGDVLETDKSRAGLVSTSKTSLVLQMDVSDSHDNKQDAGDGDKGSQDAGEKRGEDEGVEKTATAEKDDEQAERIGAREEIGAGDGAGHSDDVPDKSAEVQESASDSNVKMHEAAIEGGNKNTVTKNTEGDGVNAEAVGVTNNLPDVVGEADPTLEARKAILNTTFESEASGSFASINFDSDILNTSVESDGGLNAQNHSVVGEQSIEPTVQPTTEPVKSTNEPANEPN